MVLGAGRRHFGRELFVESGDLRELQVSGGILWVISFGKLWTRGRFFSSLSTICELSMPSKPLLILCGVLSYSVAIESFVLELQPGGTAGLEQ